MCLYANTRPVKFFKFGPAPDNPVDHLYEFSFNGETGAEFSGNEVILHFVDGKRGDSDLTKKMESLWILVPLRSRPVMPVPAAGEAEDVACIRNSVIPGMPVTGCCCFP